LHPRAGFKNKIQSDRSRDCWLRRGSVRDSKWYTKGASDFQSSPRIELEQKVAWHRKRRCVCVCARVCAHEEQDERFPLTVQRKIVWRELHRTQVWVDQVGMMGEGLYCCSENRMSYRGPRALGQNSRHSIFYRLFFPLGGRWASFVIWLRCWENRDGWNQQIDYRILHWAGPAIRDAHLFEKFSGRAIKAGCQCVFFVEDSEGQPGCAAGLRGSG
jgi:hypothetical protein